ncbi:TetR/AcrR family transcriptional regulator C-terminal domain-containing protein [Saccharomonospora glauca]|jgi:TetR/AcrR family tetracycline transcriptional repressor|uniref:Transcriptional regulator n=1 Tax=Saccharomonospora glauca K62 TaxID=928724 RepID=I1D7P6_9PSEU|nr:TetR/AcrR family transcriptional regulator C-terminal domain-containing protein [Saccharomonospora glauca]EIF00971.1 transcriptional regulator [Saccharomonospora glauca K62]
MAGGAPGKPEKVEKSGKAGKAGKALSKELIVEKAVDLLGRHGLAAVTLRRIATELGVSAPTLYWHISDKRELLDSMAEYLLRRGRTDSFDGPADGQPWWEWLMERTRAMFEAMISVRDAPQVIAGNRPTPESLAEIDRSIGVLVDAGFTPADAQQVFFVLGGYIGGMALEWQQEANRSLEDVDDSELYTAVTDAERYPYLAAAIRVGAHREPMETFQFGLDLLVRGLRAWHAERVGD